MDQDKTVYPTAPDAEGYFYEDDTDEAMGIQTQNADGKIFKKATLSDGRTAIVRQLIGTEGIEAIEIAGKIQANLPVAYAAKATVINGQGYVMEDLLTLLAKDLNKLMLMSTQLNF